MEGRLLLDTNVLLDYADPDRSGHAAAFELVNAAYENGVELLVTPCSLKDVYYVSIAAEKRRMRAAGAEPTESDCAAINEYAFSLVEMLAENMAVLADAPNDPRMAVKLQGVHPDFEDNLLVAAAMNLQGCTLVTSDRQLILHAPVSALAPADALALYGR